MIVFLITFGLFLCAFAGLGLGVLFGRAPIKGSCGGLSCMPGVDCIACPNHGAKGEQA